MKKGGLFDVAVCAAVRMLDIAGGRGRCGHFNREEWVLLAFVRDGNDRAEVSLCIKEVMIVRHRGGITTVAFIFRQPTAIVHKS